VFDYISVSSGLLSDVGEKMFHHLRTIPNLGTKYIVSDSDLSFPDTAPLDIFDILEHFLTPNVNRVGPDLIWEDVPKSHPQYDSLSKTYGTRRGKQISTSWNGRNFELHQRHIVSTMAMYHTRYVWEHIHEEGALSERLSLRVRSPSTYRLRHEDWYATNLSDEDVYYLDHAHEFTVRGQTLRYNKWLRHLLSEHRPHKTPPPIHYGPRNSLEEEETYFTDYLIPHIYRWVPKTRRQKTAWLLMNIFSSAAEMVHATWWVDYGTLRSLWDCAVSSTLSTKTDGHYPFSFCEHFELWKGKDFFNPESSKSPYSSNEILRENPEPDIDVGIDCVDFEAVCSKMVRYARSAGICIRLDPVSYVRSFSTQGETWHILQKKSKWNVRMVQLDRDTQSVVSIHIRCFSRNKKGLYQDADGSDHDAFPESFVRNNPRVSIGNGTVLSIPFPTGSFLEFRIPQEISMRDSIGFRRKQKMKEV